VKGNFYRCEVKSERVDGRVVQRYLRYLGPVIPRR
jgi:hypothetical protein